MDDFWRITLLLLAVTTVLVALIIRGSAYYFRYSPVRYERALLSRRLGGLKTGDVVLFIEHAHGFTNSFLTYDHFAHGGLVVRGADGSLFLSEAVPADPAPGGEQGRAVRSPLPERLQDYGGAAFLMELREPLTPPQEAAIRRLARQETPYPHLRHIFGEALGLPIGRKARHCMQHVAWLLDEAGLTPPDRGGRPLLAAGVLGTSRAVSSLPGRPLGGGNSFAPPVELVVDV